MLNIITIYFLTGAVFGIFAETVANWARKRGHQIDILNNIDRVLIVFLWPLGALVFFEAYWKEKNKDD